MLDASEFSFVAVFDDIHEQNLAGRTLAILFVVPYLKKPQCVESLYAYRHRDGRTGNMLKKDTKLPQSGGVYRVFLEERGQSLVSSE